MEGSAFARARAFMAEHAPAAKTAAVSLSLLTSLSYLFLVLPLTLFADLVVSQGRIPAYAELSPALRAEVMDGGEGLTGPQREASWREHVANLLNERVGPRAAELYRERVRPGSQSWEANRFGLLSPVVRYSHQWPGRALAWFASWNAWAWDAADPNASYLGGLLALAVAGVLIRGGAMVGTNVAAADASLEAVTKLRRRIYQHTFRLGTLVVRKLGPTEAVSIFTRHVEAVHVGLHDWLTSFYRYPVQAALLILLAVALDFWLALLVILSGLVIWILATALSNALGRRRDLAERRAAGRLALLQESMMMMRLVKVYLMERFNQNRVERQLNEYAESRRRGYRSEAVFPPLLILAASLAVAGLFYVAGRVVLAEGTGAGNLAVLAAVLVSLYFPARGWAKARTTIRRARESAAVMFEFLDRKPEVRQVVDAEFLPPMTKGIEFRDVSLREPGTGRMLLEGARLRVLAGQRVCVVGADEAEKHALVYLIPRFLDPTAGEIRIDGKNIRFVTQDSLRSQIALVLQHSLVFSDTVGNNIGCGDPSYGLPQIIEAAKMAHAHQFIQNLPNGYETRIGELGHSLRVGEQFRIALARAVLRDPALLIVEEPAAAMDEDTKDLVDDTMNRVLRGRTMITLPHRVSSIKRADQVFLLHEGKVVAEGLHKHLLTHSLYKHLLYLEFNDFTAAGAEAS